LFLNRLNIDGVCFNKDISFWNMSSVIDISKLFWSAWSFNGNLSQWDMSNVKETTDMFGGAHVFVRIGVNQWDPKLVEKQLGMFAGTRMFSTDLSFWNMRHVNGMSYMFALYENRSSNNVEKSWVFQESNSSFQGIGLEGWDTQ
jgi:uncharacterized Fe-S cluster-containing radical SAM superfamily protein